MRHLNFTKWAPPKHCGDDWKKCIIDITKPFDPVDYIFKISGVPRLLQRGNITVLKGEAGCGKSAFGLSFMASMLSRKSGYLRATRNDFKILWIDTEQSPATLGAKAQAVATMSGLSLSEVQKRVTVASVLPFAANQRLEYACDMAAEFRPDFIFVDGVKDLCTDFNDVAASEIVAGSLMKMASETGAAVVTVIHTNKSDEHARGHLGAILEQKAAEVYMITKNPTRDGDARMIADKDRNGNNNCVCLEFHENYTVSLFSPTEEADKASNERYPMLLDAMAVVYNSKKVDVMLSRELKEAMAEISNCSARCAEPLIKEAVQMHILERLGRGRSTSYKRVKFTAEEDFADICDDDTPNDTPTKTAPEGLRQEEPKK